jgi:uncharacterized protein (TIGR03435 family)
LAAQSFDVASIRPIKILDRPPAFQFDRYPGGHELKAVGTLELLIRAAYSLNFMAIDMKAKDESWYKTDYWNIDAKSDQAFTEKESLVLMQHLLEDKFGLKLEMRKKTGQFYLLTVDGNGPKFQKTDSTSPYQQVTVMLEKVTGGYTFVITGKNSTITRLLMGAPFQELLAPVVDQTGLDDHYDFRWVLGNPAEVAPYSIDNIITTFRRQLGLKLEEKKGMVDVLTILQMEKPLE